MARSFNGTSDRIRADSARIFAPGAARSVAFWVNVPALASSSSTDFGIYYEANTANTNSNFGLMSLASSSLVSVRLFIKNSAGGTLVSAVGTKTVFDSTWHHFCWTQDTSRNYLTYVDGAQDLTGSYGSGTVSPNDLALGAVVRSSTSNFFPGKLMDVANWTRQLAATEVVSLANGLPASHLAPDHYWPLWGNDSPEPDIGTATHVSGTLTGTAAATGGRTGRRLLTLA